MFKRNISSLIQKALKRSPVVLITGARQTGKTTLIKEITPDYTYCTFDDVRFLSAAKSDPIGFIEGIKKPTILDEVQRVPELFLTIKHDIDQNRIAGRYALTGSANPLLIPRLGDSLAGRMEIITLYPLSQGEIIGIQEHAIDSFFAGKIPNATPINKEELYQKIYAGGYPLAQSVDAESRDAWFNAYVTTILQRDVQDIAHIAGLSELPTLLQLLATRAGTLINEAEISRTLGMSSSTLRRYLVLLETVFLIQFLRPWSSNLGKRLVKSPKLYLTDTGLLSFLVGMQWQRAAVEQKIMGGIVENFVVTELTKQLSWSTVRANMFHLRTATGVEVDIVLEDPAGNMVGIEVKNSSTVGENDFKGLRYVQEEMGDKFVQGMVLYTGSQIIPFGSKLWAAPISVLWGK